MSGSPFPHAPIPSEKQLKWVADLEKRYNVKCTDFTYAGVINFIEKYREKKGSCANGESQ